MDSKDSKRTLTYTGALVVGLYANLGGATFGYFLGLVLAMVALVGGAVAFLLTLAELGQAGLRMAHTVTRAARVRRPVPVYSEVPGWYLTD